MRLTPRKMDYTNDADLTECNSTTSKRDIMRIRCVMKLNIPYAAGNFMSTTKYFRCQREVQCSRQRIDVPYARVGVN